MKTSKADALGDVLTSDVFANNNRNIKNIFNVPNASNHFNYWMVDLMNNENGNVMVIYELSVKHLLLFSPTLQLKV